MKTCESVAAGWAGSVVAGDGKVDVRERMRSRIRASVSFWAWMRCAWCRAMALWRGSCPPALPGPGSRPGPCTTLVFPRPRPVDPLVLVPRADPRAGPRPGPIGACGFAWSEAAACVNGSDVRE